MSSKPTIRDYFAVRPHPTVVRLEHLDRPDAEWISRAYCITPILAAHLEQVRRILAGETGRGVFVIGAFGSGKSHFLAYLAQRARAGDLAPAPLRAVALSLLHFRATEALEDVVAAALGVEAGAGGDRRIGYERMQARNPGGVLLLVDELSEFLRSKPDREQFTEDVRFLQFLGEWAAGHRFTLVAGMQEQIEHVGDLEHGLYRKIKDRFPVRLLLPAAHVRGLVRDAILVRHEGAEAAARRIAEDLARALPDSNLDPEEVARDYPVHPATLDFLDEVRDRFSQTRGTVDFVTAQLQGDPARGVLPFLDQPLGELLTPDRIVDHFRDLFEVQADFLALAQKLFPYYDKHLGGLFEREAQAKLAERALKLLVLVHISPAREHLTAAEAAAFLAHRAARIDPAQNVQVLKTVLDRLADAGRHVVRRGDGYALDFADGDLEGFERRLAREAADAAGRGDGVFEELLPLLAGRPFDLSCWKRDELVPRVLRWHFHERRFAVAFGAEDPAPAKVPLIAMRPFFGEQRPCPGAATVLPKRVLPAAHHFELAALARLKEARWSEATRRRLAGRIAEKTLALENEIKSAYAESRLLDATGRPESAQLPFGDGTLDSFLEKRAELLFRRLYPSFERFAPAHGPLAKDVLRRFAAFFRATDLGAEATDPAVQLVREAYLVPMGLLARAGRGYQVAKAIEKHELVRLVLPLLDHRPVPEAVFQHLAQPIYGLVPDQVQVLLVFLTLLGEIDVVKDGKSYRDLCELLPDVQQYDRVIAGRALGAEPLARLVELADGLGFKAPAQWTAQAQRRAIQRVAEHGRSLAAALQPVLFRLEKHGEGDALVTRLQELLQPWRALQTAPDEFEAFERFLGEVGSVHRLLQRLLEVKDLPGRLDRILAEKQRLQHLRNSLRETRPGGEAAVLAESIANLGDAPAIDDLARAEDWIAEAREAYGRYRDAYRELHHRHWAALRESAAHRAAAAPAIARSRHAALAAEVAAFDAAAERARAAQCTGAVDLEFQPVCRCGFDGATSPAALAAAELAQAQSALETGLARFFAREAVRDRVAQYARDSGDVTPGLAAYLKGEAPWPAVAVLDRFDRALAGVEVVRTVRVLDLAKRLEGRTLDLAEAGRAIAALLAEAAAGAERVRFDAGAAAAAGAGEVAEFCLKQSLRHGVRLPAGLDLGALAAGASALAPQDVGAAGLARLESLGLPDAALAAVLRLAVAARSELPPARAGDGALLSALREWALPRDPAGGAELAELAARLYRATPLLLAAAGAEWLQRLERLATAALARELEPLPQALERSKDAGWLVVDALGLPLLPALLPVLEEEAAAWSKGEVGFAATDRGTTTDSFYRSLVAAGQVRALVKIDAIDQLLHARDEPFADLERLAAAELRAAWRRVAPKLDPSRPLLVCADHGFRLAPSGRGYVHGGASTLERAVPVVRFEPRR